MTFFNRKKVAGRYHQITDTPNPGRVRVSRLGQSAANGGNHSSGATYPGRASPL
jgi:hypothetical protein